MPLYSVFDVYFYKGELSFRTVPTNKSLISVSSFIPSRVFKLVLQFVSIRAYNGITGVVVVVIVVERNYNKATLA